MTDHELLVAELDAINDALRDAGIEYPLGAAGVRGLAAMASGRLEEMGKLQAQLEQRRPVVKMTRGQAAELIVTTAQFWRPETVADRLLDPECPRGYIEDAVRSAVRRAQGNADTIVRLNAARDLLLRDKP